MKKMKKIMAAAIAMMTFSTAAAVTGTVAWFTANNIVSASGMSIKAEAENGIVISNESKLTWADSATASHDGKITVDSAQVQAGLVPTSTADAITWYHANAKTNDSYEKVADVAYQSFTDSAITETEADKGIYRVDLDTNTGDAVHDYKNIYLLNIFYIKAAAAEDLTEQNLYVNNVKVSSATAQDLSKALRVAVKPTGTVSSGTLATKIFAPTNEADVVHNGASNGKIGGSVTMTALGTTNGKNVLVNSVANTVTISHENDNALALAVYIYFEGEDLNCKSDNIESTLETLSIELDFGTKTKVY